MEFSVPSGSSPSVIRAAYDAEIAKTFDHLTALKIRRNTMAPIHILHDDVLSMIFYHYGTVVENPATRQWLMLMLVCKRWRTICVNHAKLWAHVSPPRPRRFYSQLPMPYRPGTLTLEERLQRTAQAPLKCQYNLSQRNINEFKTILKGEAHRIELLSLRGTSEYLFEATRGYPDLPIINSFTLEFYDPVMELVEEEMDIHNWTLSEVFAEKNASRLRSLKLSHVQFGSPTLAFNLLKDLTVLDLLSLEDQSTTAFLPTIQNLLDVVSRSPRLTLLRVHGYWFESEAEATTLNPVPKINLSHLQRLALRGGLEYITVFLQSLNFPPDAATTFELHGTVDGPRIRKFVHALRQHYHRPGAHAIRRLVVHTSPNYLQIQGYTNHKYTGLDILPEQLYFRIIANPKRGAHARHVLRRFLHMLPVEASSDLDIFMEVENYAGEKLWSCPTAVWRTVWRALPQLKSVRLENLDVCRAKMDGLLDVLQKGKQGISGRRLRRLADKHACQPSLLHLSSLQGTFSRIEHIDEASRIRERYEYLLEWLRKYRDTELPSKEDGMVWERLELEKVSGQIGRDVLTEYWPRLSGLVRSLDILN